MSRLCEPEFAVGKSLAPFAFNRLFGLCPLMGGNIATTFDWQDAAAAAADPVRNTYGLSSLLGMGWFEDGAPQIDGCTRSGASVPLPRSWNLLPSLFSGECWSCGGKGNHTPFEKNGQWL